MSADPDRLILVLSLTHCHELLNRIVTEAMTGQPLSKQTIVDARRMLPRAYSNSFERAKE